MNRAAVLYATREGQTGKIAEHVAATLREHAMDVDVYDLAKPQTPIDLHMKRIARKAGAATDTSHDYEYTDWAALDTFVNELAGVTAPH